MLFGEYEELTQTRRAKPVLGSGSAKMDTHPFGAPMSAKSCRAVSVGVMGLGVVA